MTKPPVAERRESIRTSHGIDRSDPYAWLKDPNWREVMQDPSALNADIRSYLEAENEFTEASLRPTKDLQEQLFAEMRGRIKEDDSSVPTPDGPWEYYRRFAAGGQYPIFCRRPRGESGGEQVLFDGDAEAEGKGFFKVLTLEPSPDHRLLAYSVDEQGSEYYTIRIRDLATGTDLPDEIDDSNGSVQWSADSTSIFYLRLNDNHRPVWVYHHRIGRDGDTLIYEEEDQGFYVGLGRTESGRYIEIGTGDHETSEVRLVDATRPEQPPSLVAGRRPGTQYSLAEQHDTLYITTNADDCEDFKIVTARVSGPGPEHWAELIPHQPGVLILGAVAFEQHLVRLETVEGLPRLVVRDLESGAEHALSMDDAAFDLSLAHLREYTTSLRFNYSSPATPLQVFDYDLTTGERTLRKEQEVPSGHDPDDYSTERVFATAHDGERIPVTLLYRNGTPLDGSAPCLLYGYGSYGYSMPAAFNTNRLSLVDRGMIWAIAHVRGGKEGGYRWYTTGKRDKKRNSFLDFISAAEMLIENRYTARGRIVAFGGSAGGLLVGAVLNMAPPDLFAGAIAEVPFVDVLNTMEDVDLPLTPMEWPEWGNPIDDRDAYDYIESYSPYDNIEPREYPPILATAGLTDPRVTYWEPAKWVARLRFEKTDHNLLLLRTRMGAGHAGASGRFDTLEELAEDYAFALLVTGLADDEN